MDQVYVSGSIRNGITSASVSARGSCSGAVPSGMLSGRITSGKGKGTKTYVVKAGAPSSLQSNVTTKNLQLHWEGTVEVRQGKNKSIGQSAMLVGQKLKSGKWLGQFIIYDGGRPYLTIYGSFSGNVRVNQTASCTLE